MVSTRRSSQKEASQGTPSDSPSKINEQEIPEGTSGANLEKEKKTSPRRGRKKVKIALSPSPPKEIVEEKAEVLREEAVQEVGLEEEQNETTKTPKKSGRKRKRGKEVISPELREKRSKRGGKSPEVGPEVVKNEPENLSQNLVEKSEEKQPDIEEKKGKVEQEKLVKIESAGPETIEKQPEGVGRQKEDDDLRPVNQPQRVPQVQSRSCPYLDTINRGYLDFDFEKLCSVSLSHMNVYACLVCGKYFQGRGTNTHAYTHSVDTDHRVYLNLQTFRFYCLPDNYEVIDSSLDDIKYQLNPVFTVAEVVAMDKVSKLSRALHGDETYRPGVVGLNNIKANDYCNVVLHALSHVPPLRDYFLREENYAHIKRPPGDKLVTLYQRFGELIRKLWNPKAFKSHVSPHEMLQAVVLCSQKRFQITKQGDAIDFLSWLLNTLHMSLNGTKKTSSSIIYRTFRGKMRVFSRKVLPVDTTEESKQRLLLTDEFKEVDEEIPFLYLTLDLPPAPLYRDEMLENIIPQVPLGSLLAKFNGTAEKEYKTYKENIMKRFELVKLPKFLIFYIKRFTKNAWYIEKNPTIVNFAIKNVDLFDCLSEDAKLEHRYTTYDLVGNIVHDGKPDAGQGSYRIQILHRGTGKWFELEDLHVKEILPQMITLAESYIQIWELNTWKTREERRGEVTEVILEGMETG